MQEKIRLVICRHTQTDDNARRVYTGQNDVQINETGKMQAESLARKIAILQNVRAVFSSDLLRARTVARYIASYHSLEPILTPELREVNVGKISGMLKNNALCTFSDYKYRTSNPLFDFSDVGGESYKDVIARYDKILKKIVKQFGVHPNSVKLPKIVVVAHGSALRRLFVQEYKLIDSLHKQGDYQEFDWPCK